MEISHTFFEDEVRHGFYVSGSVKRVWAAQLEVLGEIDRVCKQHGLTWYAGFGTLLGAVRHGGFIPWDDDIDICMWREDYECFLKLAGQRLPEGYQVLTMHGEDEVYYAYWARVTNGHRLNFDKEYLEKYHECPYAVGIDVFPLDYLAPDLEQENKRCEMARACMRLADSLPSDGAGAGSVSEELAFVEELCGVKFDGAKPLKQQLFETVDRLFSAYAREDASEAAVMAYRVAKPHRRFSLACYRDTVMLPFEMTELPVPQGYREILKTEYGDYMKCVRDGSVHDYPLFREQENFLISLAPEYPFRYCFHKNDLENNSRLPRRRSGERAEKFARLIEQAHKTITDLIQRGGLAGCFNLLTTCQKQAIELGTLIEEEYGEGYVTVKLLEEYCELLYEIYQILAGDGEDDGAGAMDVVRLRLTELWQKIKESIGKDIKGRRQVVFLPFKASAWNTLEDIWRAADEDENCDVYVLPIPYYERNARGETGVLHYEGEAFPKHIPVMDYKTYDLKKRHPDVIVIQNPYDGCNYTTCVPPDFFSRSLKRYTENLVYIPWFVMDEIEERDEKAKYTMKYFCTVPGPVHADKTLVQSERMRRRYIECLTAFAGEDTRKVWEKKICVNEPAAVREIVRGQVAEEQTAEEQTGKTAEGRAEEI